MHSIASRGANPLEPLADSRAGTLRLGNTNSLAPRSGALKRFSWVESGRVGSSRVFALPLRVHIGSSCLFVVVVFGVLLFRRWCGFFSLANSLSKLGKKRTNEQLPVDSSFMPASQLSNWLTTSRRRRHRNIVAERTTKGPRFTRITCHRAGAPNPRRRHHSLVRAGGGGLQRHA